MAQFSNISGDMLLQGAAAGQMALKKRFHFLGFLTSIISYLSGPTSADFS